MPTAWTKTWWGGARAKGNSTGGQLALLQACCAAALLLGGGDALVRRRERDSRGQQHDYVEVPRRSLRLCIERATHTSARATAWLMRWGATVRRLRASGQRDRARRPTELGRVLRRGLVRQLRARRVGVFGVSRGWTNRAPQVRVRTGALPRHGLHRDHAEQQRLRRRLQPPGVRVRPRAVL
jgi:hypothetical protein